MTSDEQRISSAKSGDCYTIDPQILGTTPNSLGMQVSGICYACGASTWSNGLSQGTPEGAANMGPAAGTVLRESVLGGLHHAYRRAA